MILPAADGFLPVLFLLLIMSVQGDPGAGAAAISLSPPPSPPPYPHAPKFSPFKPSVAIVVGLLTTTFSITFLLLLYAKHWQRATNAYGGSPPTALSNSNNNNKRKNSGVTRAVVESLPVFRFASLAGTKDGLECAVCLSGFEPSHVLRLLPKCKHAFHVECVDTWLDAHSTCPLCRCRVDPEDVLLLHDHSLPLNHRQSLPAAPTQDANIRTHRLSGRHSSAGERGTNKLLQIILQSSSTRRSLDSRAKPTKIVSHVSTSPRLKKNLEASSSAGADQIARNSALSEKSRQDGLLLASVDDRENFEKRFEHRIMISDNDDERQRWSDLNPSDLMYLRSEMIMNDSRRGYSSARGSPNHVAAAEAEDNYRSSSSRSRSRSRSRSKEMSNGRIVNNSRIVSDTTGSVKRRSNDDDNGGNFENRRVRRNRRVAGVLSRWLAWVPTPNQRSLPVDHSLPL